MSLEMSATLRYRVTSNRLNSLTLFIQQSCFPNRATGNGQRATGNGERGTGRRIGSIGGDFVARDADATAEQNAASPSGVPPSWIVCKIKVAGFVGKRPRIALKAPVCPVSAPFRQFRAYRLLAVPPPLSSDPSLLIAV